MTVLTTHASLQRLYRVVTPIRATLSKLTGSHVISEAEMGLLGRLFGRRQADVWRAETRWLHRLGYVHPPEAVQWITTSVCDLTCPHCYSHAGAKTRGELSTEEARTLILDELIKLDRPTFVLAGGEPLLRKDFSDVIRYCRQNDIPWAIHTHGGQIDRHADVFAEHPPIMAAVSLDGPREFHDRFRGKEGSFEAATRAMRLIKDAGCPEVVAGTTINRINADLLADMVADVLGSGCDSWGFHLMTPEGRAGGNRDLLPSAAQLRRVAQFGRRMRSIFHVELDNEWGAADEDECFYRDDPFSCGAGRHSFVVAANGDVMPCTTTDPAERQGNVREQKLSRIWAEQFEAFRTDRDPLRSNCDDCWLQTRHGCSARPAFSVDLFDESLEGPADLVQLEVTR